MAAAVDRSSPRGEGAKRAEYFSDAILAIAITLLVIEIKVPATTGQGLADALRRLWPSYLAYILSFSTIGLVWIAHHAMFERIARASRPLLMLNLALLACVAFLPFSTAVLAQYSTSGPAGERVAAQLYSVNMSVIGVAFLALWVFLYYRPQALVAGVDRALLVGSITRSALVPCSYVVTLFLAEASTVACFAIWIATTLYIALGPSTRRLRRPARATAGPDAEQQGEAQPRQR